jgi:predicted DsbA family dithiol-disulfide isomerase
VRVETIRFHFDPRCPWCYQTSRWASRLEELDEVSIDWALFSLEVVNRAEGVDPLTIDARSGPSLRTASLLRERAGREAVGALYHAFGKRVWQSDVPMEVDDLQGIRDSLLEIGADAQVLDEALTDRGTWEAVVQEHEALVSRTGAFGVPTIVLDGGEGPAIFGPVIYELPDDEKTVELWHHTAWLVRNGNFAELKRGRGRLPDLPAMEYRVRQYAERGGQRTSR